MKKQTVILVCTLLLCSFLTGCVTKTGFITENPSAQNDPKTELQENEYFNTKEKRAKYVTEERKASLVLHEETFGDSIFCLYKCNENEYGVVEFCKPDGENYRFKSYFTSTQKYPHTTYTISGREGDIFFVGKNDYRYVEVVYENGAERADLEKNPISFIPHPTGEKPVSFVFYDEDGNKLYEDAVI